MDNTIAETVKLYDLDAYETAFEAVVQDVSYDKGHQYASVVLDRTLFFPEEGGQSCDMGEIEGFEVVDVRISGGIITHKIRLDDRPGSKEFFREGRKVSGSIDFEHRFSNMQNHSGEHILSGLIASEHGYRNTGFHLSDSTVYLQFGGILEPDQLKALELKANEAVWKNLKISAVYPEPEELDSMYYRSKSEIDGPVRIVTIEGIDVCACCAPHVRRTGEIGIIKILDAERMGDEMRLTILCGKRALAEIGRRQDDMGEVVRLTSKQPGDTASGVSRILQENAELKEKLGTLSRRYIAAVNDRYAAAGDNVLVFEDIADVQYRRELVNLLCLSHKGMNGVFCGNDRDGYDFIIGAGVGKDDSGENIGIDARECCQRLKDAFGARGGGSAKMVQGSVKASKRDILALLS